MKRVLVALFLCVVFSFSAHAKKQMIGTSTIGGLHLSTDGLMCKYTCTRSFSASVHTHKSTKLLFNLLVDDVSVPLDSWSFPETDNFTGGWCNAFYVGPGKSWAVAWTLESTKGKGRIIDAAEGLSGTCEL